MGIKGMIYQSWITFPPPIPINKKHYERVKKGGQKANIKGEGHRKEDGDNSSIEHQPFIQNGCY